jgi:adenylylsulfate kinase
MAAFGADGGPPPVPGGATVWLTGLPSAGKSTIAQGLVAHLDAEGLRCHVLDGDEVRPYLSSELGYSKEDRDLNVRRIGYVAELLAIHGVVAVVPVIAPYTEARAAVRASHAARGVRYLEVYVDAALDVCRARDVKGLYAKQSAGLLSGLTGVDDPYEPPCEPDLRLRTDELSIETSIARVHALLMAVPAPRVASIG